MRIINFVHLVFIVTIIMWVRKECMQETFDLTYFLYKGVPLVLLLIAHLIEGYLHKIGKIKGNCAHYIISTALILWAIFISVIVYLQ